jgi:MFS transporter, DHA1 family, inner membrane transport protein
VSLLGAVPVGTVAGFAVFGTATGVFVPAQQTRLVALAPTAPEFALAANLSSLNLGIAVGAAIGSAVVDRGGLAILGYLAAGVVLLAVALTAGTTSRS